VGPAPYRSPPRPAAPDPYLAAWARYHERRWLKWVLFFAWPPVAWVAIAMMRPGEDGGGLYVCLTVAVVALAVMGWLGAFSCPRCNGRMYVRQSALASSRDGCPHCGLDVGTPKFPPL
jgi:hypothetical protein